MILSHCRYRQFLLQCFQQWPIQSVFRGCLREKLAIQLQSMTMSYLEFPKFLFLFPFYHKSLICCFCFCFLIVMLHRICYVTSGINYIIRTLLRKENRSSTHISNWKINFPFWAKHNSLNDCAKLFIGIAIFSVTHSSQYLIHFWLKAQSVKLILLHTKIRKF